jgi:hypothetical protein
MARSNPKMNRNKLKLKWLDQTQKMDTNKLKWLDQTQKMDTNKLK